MLLSFRNGHTAKNKPFRFVITLPQDILTIWFLIKRDIEGGGKSFQAWHILYGILNDYLVQRQLQFIFPANYFDTEWAREV